MSLSVKFAACFFAICLCSGASPEAEVGAQTPAPEQPASSAAEAPSKPAWIALDLAAPGAGALRRGDYGWAAFFAGGRLATAYYAYVKHIEYLEYRSAARAARLADLYYGPGLYYRDPYSSGFRNSDGFQREADRRSYLSTLALSLHLLLTGLSVYQTGRWLEEEHSRTLPEFELEAGLSNAATDWPPASEAQASPGYEFSIRWRWFLL
ncbi:MAG: hypothetical protein K1X75_07940 [Leptospirales bacterium]|nr:hypothetical protein [Leptospirales bacterium]